VTDVDQLDDGIEQTAPVWAVFGDLMSGLLGAFVLILIGVLVVQMELMTSLEAEVAKRRQEEQRRMALRKSLGHSTSVWPGDVEQRAHWHQWQRVVSGQL
jgi:hypothetical protein